MIGVRTCLMEMNYLNEISVIHLKMLRNFIVLLQSMTMFFLMLNAILTIATHPKIEGVLILKC